MIGKIIPEIHIYDEFIGQYDRWDVNRVYVLWRAENSSRTKLNTVWHVIYHYKYHFHEFQTYLLVTILFSILKNMQFL